ncbi:MAG: hypothetical protein V3S08_05215 [Phycisphaerales bacterium]
MSVVLAAGYGVAALTGCSGNGQTTTPSTQVAPAEFAPEYNAVAIENAGARVWARNCIRCHNIRSPASFSDRQWGIIVHHMRVKANLTGEQQEAVLRFLQAAN